MRAVFLIPVFVSLLAVGQHTHADTPGDRAPPELSVKPLLCITDKRHPSCDMAFVIRWRSQLPGDFCLFNDFASLPLNCWDEKTAGHHSEQRSIDKEFKFWLTDKDFAVRLVEVTVEVMSADSSDRRRYRRRRHAWSVL